MPARAMTLKQAKSYMKRRLKSFGRVPRSAPVGRCAKRKSYEKAHYTGQALRTLKRDRCRKSGRRPRKVKAKSPKRKSPKRKAKSPKRKSPKRKAKAKAIFAIGSPIEFIHKSQGADGKMKLRYCGGITVEEPVQGEVEVVYVCSPKDRAERALIDVRMLTLTDGIDDWRLQKILKAASEQ